MTWRSFGAAALVAALAVGCKGEDGDVEPAFVPKVVAFEGQVDAKYAGDWSTADRASRLDLRSDGTALIESTVNSPGGKATTRLDGKWLAQGGNLLVQYGDAKRGTTTLKYAATLSGGKLVLQQPGGRLKTAYSKR